MGVEGSTYPDNQPLLLQDNATVHTAAIAKTALAQAGIQSIPGFPPNSPDLNPYRRRMGTPEASNQQPHAAPEDLRRCERCSDRRMGCSDTGRLFQHDC